MEELRVIGAEDGALLVTTESGERYRIPIDDALTSTIRKATKEPGTARRLAPKDIQAHIRSGMSAQDVAAITGASIEYIQRFEGPILAEREFVIESALSVPIHTAKDTEFGDTGATFGSAILARLHELSATGERWASWKEEASGWVIKLSFTANSIDHDARWRFDPKRSSLAPLNNEAESLSRQGELTGTLIPRLRAVDGDRAPDTSRFDSGAFLDQELPDAPNTRNETLQDTAPHLEAVPYGRSRDQVDGVPTTVPSTSAWAPATSTPAAQSPSTQTPSTQTADLLEALRRRRGERESAHFEDVDDAMSEHPSTGSIRLVNVPLHIAEDETQPTPPKPTKRGRASVPSWDEIVFGARSDDDPA